MKYTIQAACGCHIGKIRKNNEDNFFFDGKCLEEINNGLKHPAWIEEDLKNGFCVAVFDGIQADAKDDIICPVCNYKQRADRKVCWKCGHKLSVGTSKVNEWQCVCGRTNPAYVSTCYCGVNKYDMSNAPTPNRPTSHKEYADGEYVSGRIYYNGDEVLFEGEKYLCIAPKGVQCVWNPSQHPKHWQLIVKQPTEDWRKSEAAHRAWLKSLEEKQ